MKDKYFTSEFYVCIAHSYVLGISSKQYDSQHIGLSSGA